jgi:hypothetical protein
LPRTVSARTKRLRAKRLKVLKGLDTLDREIGELERDLGIRRRPARRAASGTPRRRPNARRLNEVTVADAIVKLLSQRKRPLHYRKIAETLVREKRYRTKSRNFLSTVAITIMRDKRIKRVEPGVYTLRRR